MAGVRYAVAQGTSGTLADPMGANEVAQYMERAGIDARRVWDQVDAAHVEYLAKCEKLRGEQLERLQAGLRDLYGSGGIGPSADAERWVRAYLAARRALAQSDNELFDAIALSLPAGDQARLSRARGMRERDALRVAIARGTASESALADLPAIFRGVEPPTANDAALWEECEVALQEYDNRQGRLLREYADAVAEALPKIALALESVPRPDPATATDEELAAFVERGKEAMAREFAPAAKIARALVEGNGKSAKAVHARLAARDPEWAKRFRIAYLASAYPSIGDGESLGVRATAVRAIRMKALGEGERAAIRRVFEGWSEIDDRSVDAVVVAENTYAEASSTHVGSLDDAEVATHMAKTELLRSQREEAASVAIAQIAGIAGPRFAELSAKLGSHEEAEHFLPEGSVGLTDTAAASAPVAEVAQTAPAREVVGAAGDSLFHGVPMEQEWTERIVRSLGATEAQAAIIDALRRDHADEWAREIAPLTTDLATIHALSVRGGGEAAFDEDWIVAQVAKAAALRRAHRALDAALFADIDAAIGDPKKGRVIALLRGARECGARIPGLDDVFDGRSGGEENANIAFAIISVKLPAEECAKAAEVLAPRLEGLTRATSSVDSSLAGLWKDRAMGVLIAASLAKLNDASLWSEAQREARRRTEAIMGAGVASTKAKAKAQREAMEAVRAVLSESARVAVEGAYLRDAYLPAYGESEPTFEALERALALPGLSDEQRTKLVLAKDEYRAKREAAVQEMVKVMQRDAQSVGAAGAEQSAKETWAHIDDLQRFAFARDAARDQLAARLKAVLGEEQRRIVGLE